jgi:hypothetical protein
MQMNGGGGVNNAARKNNH